MVVPVVEGVLKDVGSIVDSGQSSGGSVGESMLDVLAPSYQDIVKKSPLLVFNGLTLISIKKKTWMIRFQIFLLRT